MSCTRSTASAGRQQGIVCGMAACRTLAATAQPLKYQEAVDTSQPTIWPPIRRTAASMTVSIIIAWLHGGLGDPPTSDIASTAPTSSTYTTINTLHARAHKHQPQMRHPLLPHQHTQPPTHTHTHTQVRLPRHQPRLPHQACCWHGQQARGPVQRHHLPPG